ncbi:Mur ligase family protein [Fuchsiella alkaliacetigena]|uniref:Mur ligase family protein n=1 Tax=Fuchsiella alkaliacetigena TaxID=957042 RepID=UPI00200A7F22|nr:UDP-N-acetylmuramyl-tripeptide synthetase [Fuchsiella alkaliacetigena]MCK8823915.1 UDP-N-acetylmuramyl-tripeptide synthetase [Fuchsiella alkaliacetigena]
MKIGNQDILGITCDSREVKPGYAFVAIKGFEDDGNKYINEAIESGAKVIYTEEDINGLDSLKVPIIKVNNARQRLAQLANQLYNQPSKKLTLIGVTGTNGKTTTTHLIEHLFAKNNFKTGLIGTVKTKIDNKVKEAQLTTPGAVEISNCLNEMVQRGVNVATMEVSSHGIKLDRTAGLDFDLIIYTNLGRDHFDLHENFADYLNTKKKLFQEAAQDKIALINIDDAHAEEISSALECRVINYGFSERADIQAELIAYGTEGSRFRVSVEDGLSNYYGSEIVLEEFELELQLLGKHNIYNALAAIAAALLLGLSVNEIKTALKSFQPFYRRLNVIYDYEFTIIDDCAHNYASYKAVFETIKDLEYNDLYIINAIRGNRGVQVNKEIAEAIAEFTPLLGVTELYISNCERLAGSRDQVTAAEKRTVIQTLNEQRVDFEFWREFKPALLAALAKVDNGDLVLLLGAHAMDQAADISLNILQKSKEVSLG